MTTTEHLLSVAREIIEEPERWTQDFIALDADKWPTSPTAPDACQWCATGAIQLAKHRTSSESVVFDEALRMLGAAVVRQYPGLAFNRVPGQQIMKMNDMPDQEHGIVLALFDDAIRLSGGNPDE